MIKSFKDKETELVFKGIFSKKLPQNIQKIALRKLIMINSSDSFNDLKIPLSNRLEKLNGKLVGYWSIRINNQYRVIFKISEKEFDCYDVEIVDYH